MSPLLNRQTQSQTAYLNQTYFLWFFSFCIVGLTFKQLKFSSLIGPVELLALVGIVAGLFLTWRSGELSKQAQLISFLGVGFLVFNLGTLWAAAAHPETISVREVLAYSFTFLVLLTFLVLAYRRELDAVRIVGSAIGLYLLAAVVLAMIPSPVQPYLWYYGVKFQGFSDNPNQVAFLAIVGLSFLTCYDVLSGGKRGRIKMAAAVGCVVGGIFTASGAFTVGLLCVVVLAIAAYINRKITAGRPILPKHDHDASGWQIAVSWLRKCRSRLPFPITVVILAYVAKLLLVGIVSGTAVGGWNPLNRHMDFLQLVNGQGVFSNQSQFGTIMEGDAAQGTSRLKLWNGALEVAKTSPLVGLGPGTHIPYEIDGVLHKYEAHNTVLDIVLVSGMAGLCLICVCLFWAIRSALKAQMIYPLLIILGPIGLFSMLHYTGRQPLFWIAIALAVIIVNVSHVVKNKNTQFHANNDLRYEH